MAKQYKIKRHRNRSVYRAKPHPFVVIAGILAVAGLVFVGISIYEPVFNFIMGNTTFGDREPVSQLEEFESEPDTEPEPEPEPQPVLPGDMRAVYLPVTVAENETALDEFLNSLSGLSINTVLLDIKDATGTVLFQTANREATEWSAVSTGALNLEVIAAKVKAKNLELAVRMSVFRDPIAARNGRENAIYYAENPEWLWLDNTAELGGQPWLNPYAQGAWNYIISLASDAVDKGATTIVLENVQFPVGSGSSAAFGSGTSGIDRATILHSFVEEITERMADQGARVALSVSALSMTQEWENDVRYGGSPLALAKDAVIADVLPYNLSAVTLAEGLEITDPAGDPAGTVKTALQYMQQNLPGADTQLIAMVQGGPDGGIDMDRALVEAQLAAAEELGIGEYLLYQTGGTYPQADAASDTE